MAEDRWLSRDVPLLERIYQLEQENSCPVDSRDLLHADEDLATLNRDLKRLISEGYLDGNATECMQADAVRVRVTGVKGNGLRAVGAWPSGDPYEAALAVLDAQIEEEPDEERRAAKRRLRDTLVGAGKDITVSVLTGVLKQLAGLP